MSAAAAFSIKTPEDFVEFVRMDADNSKVKEIIKQMDDIGRKYYSGRNYYSVRGSGYISYGEPSVPEKNQKGNVTLPSGDLDLIREQFKVHYDKDMKHDYLPSSIGHSGLLDIEALPEIKIYDPADLQDVFPSFKIKTTKFPSSKPYKVGDVEEPKVFAPKGTEDEVLASLKAKYKGIKDVYIEMASQSMNGITFQPYVKSFIEILSSKGRDGALITPAGSKEVFESGKYFVIDIAPGDNATNIKKAEPATIYLRIRAPKKAVASRGKTVKGSACAGDGSKSAAGCGASTRRRRGGRRTTRKH
jgi:hypothetical protein